MSRKVLFSTDLHKRDIDFSSIKGYVSAVDAVQEDLLNFIKKEEVNYFISAGDWYDKGYRSVGRHTSDENYDRAISDAVNGEAYITLGNHIYIEREQNPELYMIQPNDLFKPANPIYATKPVFKAVKELVIGKVQISFFHFDKHDKEYINRRLPGITHHIGVYHDDTVLPSNIRKAAGYEGYTSSDYLARIYDNIDIAIIGHIHVKVGVENLQLPSGRKLPLIVPGALCITQNKDALKHKTVMLPMIIIGDDDSVQCKLYPFSTHLEKLRFYSMTRKESTAYEGAPDVPVNIDELSSKYTIVNSDLRTFLRNKQYEENYIDLVDKSLVHDLQVSDVMKILGRK